MEVKIKIKTADIDYYIEKPDAILLYTIKGKCWVCDKFFTNLDNPEWTTIILKGKSGKYGQK